MIRGPDPTAKLHDALIEHRVGNLRESRDVRAVDVVALDVVRLRRGPTLVVDRAHDLAQTAVDVVALPHLAAAVLRHLQTAYRDPAGVRRLGGPVEDAGFEEPLDA